MDMTRDEIGTVIARILICGCSQTLRTKNAITTKMTYII